MLLNLLRILLAGAFTISFIIFIHELGHFLAARAVGIHVHRFSIGFGPVLLKWRAFSTEWALSLLPFGGYVKMAGMVDAPGEGEVPDDEDTLPPESLYRNKAVWQRLTAIIAGPLANLILALLISMILIYQEGEPIYPGTWLGDPVAESPAAAAGIQRGDRIVSWDGVTAGNWNELGHLVNDAGSTRHRISLMRDEAVLEVELDLGGGDDPASSGLVPILDNRIGNILVDGPADLLGLETGDRIVAINGETVRFFDRISEIVNGSAGVELAIEWDRDGQRFQGSITPAVTQIPDPENREKMIEGGRIYYEPYLEWRAIGPGEAIKSGAAQVGYWSTMTLGWLGKVFTGRGDKESVGGPIQIFRTAGEMLRWGFGRLFTFIAFFSTQLFLLNLLPIPVLDGGHILFLGFEAVGRPVSEEIRMRLTMVGLAVMLGLMAIIVLLDILKVFA
jgi:regulator of sigma E protease